MRLGSGQAEDSYFIHPGIHDQEVNMEYHSPVRATVGQDTEADGKAEEWSGERLLQDRPEKSCGGLLWSKGQVRQT
jgi:hypothetical protein